VINQKGNKVSNFTPEINNLFQRLCRVLEFIPGHKHAVLLPWWVNTWECFLTVSEDQVLLSCENTQLPLLVVAVLYWRL